MECEEFRAWSTHRNRSAAIKAYAGVDSNLFQSSSAPTNSVFFSLHEFEPRFLLQSPGPVLLFLLLLAANRVVRWASVCRKHPPLHIGGIRRNCLHFIKNIFSPILCSRYGESFGALQSNYSCRASFFCLLAPLCAFSEFHLFSHLRSGVRKGRNALAILAAHGIVMQKWVHDVWINLNWFLFRIFFLSWRPLARDFFSVLRATW